MPIKSIQARQIFDSRGNPTVEVDLVTELGLFRAAVPSGASTGVHEALELRDNDKSKYHGKSVFQAIENVNNSIAPALIKSGLEVTQQTEIDDFMIKLDGTENKAKLGANAILGVSLAVAKAGAAKRGIPLYRHIADLADNKDIILPVPAFNVINGGSHAGNKLAMQEFLIFPTGARTFAEAMRMGTEVYQHLKLLINKKYKDSAVGDDGGFSPMAKTNKDVLNLINSAIEKAGHTGKIELGIDAAASDFYKKGKYDLNFKEKKSDKNKWLTSDKLTKQYNDLMKKYPIISIEDPFCRDDLKAWVKLKSKSGEALQIVGDDLTATNPKLVEKAIEQDAANCLLLKLNQIGTLTETIVAYKMAKESKWGTIVSHDMGETEDTFISDLVVGLSAGQLKTGAPCRSDRLAKYNQILRIEEELGSNASYAGRSFRPYA